MAGDITPDQLRFIESDGLTMGRTYFAKDGNLHAGPGDFCPFDKVSPPKIMRDIHIAMPDGETRIWHVEERMWGMLATKIEEFVQEENTRLLVENQRLHARRFRMNRMRYRR